MNDAFVKEEILSSIQIERHDVAFLSALVALGGEIILRNKEIMLDFVTYNAKVALEFCKIIKTKFDYGTEITIKQPEDKRHSRYFVINMSNKVASKVLDAVGLIKLDKQNRITKANFGVMQLVKDNERCFASYIKGIFLMKGKVFLYEGNYLAELLVPNADFAKEIVELLYEYNIYCNTTPREDKTVIRIKSGESVSDFLVLCGATESALELKNTIIRREMSNKINREANCEVANSERNAQASVRQVNAILQIINNNQADKLPKELKEVADYKIQYPEATFAQMASHFGLTKSGISHRINKILSIAQSITKEENK